MIKLIECPRDAMQGIRNFIPTDRKVAFINQLLQVGFDTIDFGSFVSPKAIPQLKDTEEVLGQLHRAKSKTSLLAIVANLKGAEKACSLDQIDFVGFPFSISETFQIRNTNSSIEDSFETIKEIHELASMTEKQLVLYISMAFGNPYGDAWNADIVINWIEKLVSEGIRTFALSDTIGVSTSESIDYLFGKLIPAFPDLEIGAHFHSRPHQWEDKFVAALEAGCRRFDGAIKGYGGCPMAKDELTGNMATENMVAYLNAKGTYTGINMNEFEKAMEMAAEIFTLS
jgi:hydroxymethylglutaryl-CoA lyase